MADEVWPPVDIDTTPPRKRGRPRKSPIKPKRVIPFRGAASIRLEGDTYEAMHLIHAQTGLPLNKVVNGIIRGYYRQSTPAKVLYTRSPYGIVEIRWGVEVGEFVFTDENKDPPDTHDE